MTGRSVGCLGSLGRAATILLAAVFVLTLPIALLAFNVGRVAFSRVEVASVVIQRAVDSGGLRRLMAERLLDPGASDAGSDFNLARAMSFLGPDELERVYDLLIPPEWARSQVSAALEGLYAWIDSDRLRPSMELDLRPIQDHLASGGASRLVEIILASWPDCTVEQLDELALAAISDAVPMQYCEPPEPFRSVLAEFAAQGVLQMVRDLPPKADLLSGDSDLAWQTPEELLALKEQIRMLRGFSRWGWLLPLSLLGLIMALAVRSVRGLTRWWGMPLLLGGALSFLVAVGASGSAGRLFARAIGEPALPDAFLQIVKAVAEGLSERVLGRMAVQSVFLAGGAALLLVVGLFFGRARAHRPSEVATPPAAPAAPDVIGAEQMGEKDAPTGMFG
jgi:hypothetical protein